MKVIVLNGFFAFYEEFRICQDVLFSLCGQITRTYFSLQRSTYVSE